MFGVCNISGWRIPKIGTVTRLSGSITFKQGAVNAIILPEPSKTQYLVHLVADTWLPVYEPGARRAPGAQQLGQRSFVGQLSSAYDANA